MSAGLDSDNPNSILPFQSKLSFLAVIQIRKPKNLLLQPTLRTSHLPISIDPPSLAPTTRLRRCTIIRRVLISEIGMELRRWILQVMRVATVGIYGSPIYLLDIEIVIEKTR